MRDKQTQEDIECYECGANFTIKYGFEQDRVIYCPFCGTDIPHDDEDEEDEDFDDYNDHDDYEEKDY